MGIYPVGTLVRLESGLIGIIVKHGEKNLLHPVVRVVYNARNGNFLRVPYDVDLEREAGNGRGEDRILCYEPQKSFGIRPEMYL